MAKGRPPKFNSVEEMQSKIDEYFIKCKGKVVENNEGEIVLNKYGEPVYVNVEPPTIIGLSLYLGFNSKQSFYDYKGKKDFLDCLTRASSMCEHYAAQRLFDRDGSHGAEFYLKAHFKWNDKQAESENEKALIVQADKILVTIRDIANGGTDETN